MTERRTSLRLPRETWLLAMVVPVLGFVPDVILFPQMWRLSAQSEAINFVVAVALALIVHGAFQRLPRLWIAATVVGVLLADLAQSLIEVQLLAAAARGGHPGVDGYVLPTTAEAKRMMLVLRLQANLLEFGFFATAISLILVQRAALEARLRSKAAELEVLRLQLAPHFLMNAFSSLLALIETDRRRDASRMVANLSSFFRAVLLSSVQPSTPLEQELENLQDYLAIEQARYGERLAVEVELSPAAAQAPVPPMLLQPLAENVIHHVVAHSTQTVTLRVAASLVGGVLEIRVSNTIPPDWRPTHQGTGVGQANVAERLLMTYGRRASLARRLSPASYDAVIRVEQAGPRRTHRRRGRSHPPALEPAGELSS